MSIFLPCLAGCNSVGIDVDMYKDAIKNNIPEIEKVH